MLLLLFCLRTVGGQDERLDLVLINTNVSVIRMKYGKIAKHASQPCAGGPELLKGRPVVSVMSCEWFNQSDQIRSGSVYPGYIGTLFPTADVPLKQSNTSP